MGRMQSFKEWFFKGRIEKARIKEKRNQDLMKEYKEGQVLSVKVIED